MHPEGAQREAAESQILLLLGTQREWNSESAGRPRPTEAKMRSPTPCQEHYQTNTKRGPPEQLFLQSYTGDYGRPADRRTWRSADSTQTKAARCGFQCCCVSSKRPKRGHEIADSNAVGHPEGAQAEAARSQILVLLRIQKAPKERPPNRRFYCCWAPREGGIQRAPAELGRQRKK